MTRYAVNRFMRQVNMDPTSLERYVEDPEAFLRSYESQNLAPAAALNDRERSALEARDYAHLYAMGAHPYLLWSFTEAVLVPPTPRPELVESFRTAAAAVGYPDWATTPAPEIESIDGGHSKVPRP